jgi:AcrR family transcriptional regulator
MTENIPKKQTNRDIQASERRQQILDVAMQLFAANGYHATSCEQLIEWLECRKL